MSKIDDYARTLASKANWIPYLKRESNLPGPRGNLELAQAVARVGTRARFDELLGFANASTNTAEEFLLFCGVLGLGSLVAAGDRSQLERIRVFAGDERWRIREAVAMALQSVGDADIALLQQEAATLSKGGWLEKRAAAAALAEPRLLNSLTDARKALGMLNAITAAMAGAGVEERRDEAFKALRRGMGYCWSVVVTAAPDDGKTAMERWFANTDPDVAWMMRENLKKNRLIRMDPDWVAVWQARLKEGSRRKKS